MREAFVDFFWKELTNCRRACKMNEKLPPKEPGNGKQEIACLFPIFYILYILSGRIDVSNGFMYNNIVYYYAILCGFCAVYYINQSYSDIIAKYQTSLRAIAAICL